MSRSIQRRDPEGAANVAEPRGFSRLYRSKWITFTAIFLMSCVIATIVLRSFFIDVYTVSQDSMRPTLDDGERILVDKTYNPSEDIELGDVIVFDGTGSFTPYASSGGFLLESVQTVGYWFGFVSPPATFVKRVIGVEGDAIRCCGENGRLSVNDVPLEEPYLMDEVRGDSPASAVEFDVVVPPGRVWVLGDNRAESVDSRALLGAPGGGMISQDRIIGRVVSVYWPWEDRRALNVQPTTGKEDRHDD